jgi:transcriptional regulator with XRE-family HTH domain
MALGANIRRLREAKGLQQQEFAKRVGVAASTAADWESGKMNPRVDRLADIAGALECELAELVA